MRVMIPALIATVLVVSACTSMSKDGQTESKSALVVHAHASVTHFGRTYTQSFADLHVIATDSTGRTTVAPFGTNGNATVRLAPGRYEITTSERDLCFPVHIRMPRASLTLGCALP